MVQIRILPPEVVNRIAAGEVIERPASVVKELVENAIDAGATEIQIEVEEGGRRRIRVRDNGGGMEAGDLPLAFESHATSKLPGGGEDDPAGPDLFNIPTLGFRGEALASIASVAEVEVVSRPPGAELAQRYRPSTRELEPVAGPPGTSMEVRNLFFNVPARRKFLRAPSTELSHLVDQVVRLAMGFPGIRFTLSSAGKRLLDCPAGSSPRERLAAVVGRERAARLIEVREPPGGVPGLSVRGFVSPPDLHRQDTRGQHFFVDGRWVRDKVLSHALQEAYRGFQIPGQRPLCYLFVDVPAGAVDVNVHPTKSEVRFLDSPSVHRAAYAAVRDALDRRGPGAGRTGAPAAGLAASGLAAPEAVGPAMAGGARLPAAERIRSAALDFLSSGLGDGGPAPPRNWPPQSAGAGGARTRPEADFPPREAGGDTVLPLDAERDPAAAHQILNAYLLLEVEEGILLFDQHALHEKVLYERILAQLREGAVPRQKLLLPEVVELPLDLAPLVEEVAERLGPLGFEVERFGPREAAVHAVPSILGETPGAPVVLETARWVREGFGEETRDGAAGGDPLGAQVRKLAQMVACKRAVKAGAPLAPEEIRSLLAAGGTAVDPRFCPHGRPTSVLLTRAELERRFQRR